MPPAVLGDRVYHYSQFTDEQTEVQRRQVIVILGVFPHMSIKKNSRDNSGVVQSL